MSAVHRKWLLFTFGRPTLHKMAGTTAESCVCVVYVSGAGGSESRVLVCRQQEMGGGAVERELSFLTAWWMKLSLILLALAQRLRSHLPDGSRVKKQ